LRPLRFFLKPFPGEGNPAGIAIGGSIARSADALSVRCEVRGDLSKVSIPLAAEAPRRQDRLWEETCLELFLGTTDSAEYWEVNLSPSGHWNVYRFDKYREGMREEPGITSLPFQVRTQPDALRLSLDLDLRKILPQVQGAVEAGVCAVLRPVAGKTSHWALTHPASRPDFHRRDGFALILPGEG
jgi:hypothetical protein